MWQRQEVQELPRRCLRVANERRAWATLGAVAFGNLVVAALHFGLAAAAPLLREDLELTSGQLGILLATPAIGLMLGTFGWGVLADRTSERRVLTGAFVGFAAATAVAATHADAANVVYFGMALLVSGCFGSAAHSAGGRAISASFAPERHGLVLSIRHVAIPVGAALGGIVVPIVVRDAGLGAAAWTAAFAGVVAAALLAIAVPSSRTRAARVAREQVTSGPSPLRVLPIWLLAAGAAGLSFVQLGIGSFLTVQLVDRAGMTVVAAAAVFTAAQLGGAAGRVVLGLWSDRAGSRIEVLRAVAVVSLVSVLASLVVPDARAAAFLQAVALVVVTSCNGVVVAVAASIAPEGRTGATLGMQTTANAAACSVAPIVLGVVLGAGAGWTAFTAVLLGSLVLSLVALSRCARLLRAPP